MENLAVDTPAEIVPDEVEVIDVSTYQPKNVPSLTWRERIKKIWKDDPLICPLRFPLVLRKRVARNASQKRKSSRLSFRRQQ